MSQDCPVCRGRREIELPLYLPLPAVADLDLTTAVSLECQSRGYPCPECCDIVDIKRIEAISTVKEFETEVPREIIKAVSEQSAYAFVGKLIRDGFVRIEERVDRITGKTAIRCTLGAVPIEAVDRLEAKIAARQEEIAHDAAAEAVRGINNWGSYYGHTTISKGIACDQVREAVGTVLKRRADWKRQTRGEAKCVD
jgi:hypothetical protein